MYKKSKFIKNIIISAICCITLLGTSVQCKAATEMGTYPTRKGVILVTSDSYKGLIPTGHAAIVYSQSYVVEALNPRIVVQRNNWKSKHTQFWGMGVNATSEEQDARAADYCYRQVGKKYNFNWLNVKTRSKFYCSQLVWAAFKDLYGINLDTSAFGQAIHPMEIVKSPETSQVYYYHK